MGILDLQICATLENLTRLHLPPSDNWHFSIKCTHCNEPHPNVVYFNLQELREVPDSKAEAHYYAKCSLCKREQTILFIAGSQKTYENSGSWQTIARFECRGVELVDFKAGNGWLAFGTASEDTEFGEIDLSEGDWAGYDEAGDASVGVYEFKSQVIRGTGKK
ncbi:hypothetical protein FGO68_gene5806 [Halteria grandinella]|uniref:DUF866 domain-containing protein n=1 Tax=Halteria grandinella TaxID=5974 RepID=A0A8J8NIT6_HALGN|nr:hypothetical protein FGO68_gene5806 [Halteria grandinella]